MDETKNAQQANSEAQLSGCFLWNKRLELLLKVDWSACFGLVACIVSADGRLFNGARQENLDMDR